MHHGSERRHIDRNYGGFFIAFDRLLGTFAREDREPRYGVPGGFDIASPLVANTYLFARLATASAGRAGSRWRLWFGPPEASAHIVSSAGHATRVVAGASLVRTWLPLAAGAVGAVAIALFELPASLRLALGIASIALLERAAAPLDGR